METTLDAKRTSLADVRAKIDEMVRRIVERFDPEKVILFGSHARGQGGPDSDADLLVVMRFRGSRRRQATEIDLALVGVDLPADVLVISPEELEADRDRPWNVVCPAVREGEVAYERGV